MYVTSRRHRPRPPGGRTVIVGIRPEHLVDPVIAGIEPEPGAHGPGGRRAAAALFDLDTGRTLGDLAG
jgi:hypothetical protein